MLALPVFVAVFASGQAPVTLKFDPPVGKVYQYRITSKYSQSSPSAANPTDVQQVADAETTVISKAGRLATLVTKIGKSKTILPPGSAFADNNVSTEQEPPPPIRSKISQDFRSVDVASAPSGTADVFWSQFTNLAIPSHAISIGEAWSTEVDVSKFMGGGAVAQDGPGKLRIKLKLESVHSGVVRIGLATTGSFSVSGEGGPMNFSVVGKGWVEFEIASGMPRSMQMSSEVEVTGSKTEIQFGSGFSGTAETQKFSTRVHMNESVMLRLAGSAAK